MPLVSLGDFFYSAFSVPTRATLSWSFGRTDELEGAKRAAEHAARLAPDAVETRVALGYELYYGLRDYEGALAQLQQAREVDPGNPAVLLPLGYVFRRQGKMVEAAAVFEQAFMLDPHRYETAHAAAVTFQWLRDYDAAERYWMRAAAILPSSAWPFLGMARTILLRDGDRVRALEILRKGAESSRRRDLLDLDPAMTRVLAPLYTVADSSLLSSPSVALATVLEHQGALAEARAAYDSVRVAIEAQGAEQKTPTHEYVGWKETHLAMAYAGLGMKAEALQHIHRATALLPAADDALQGVVWRMRLAEILTRVGEYDRALDELDAVLSVPAPVSALLLRIDPVWEPLRLHSRFRPLAAAGAG